MLSRFVCMLPIATVQLCTNDSVKKSMDCFSKNLIVISSMKLTLLIDSDLIYQKRSILCTEKGPYQDTISCHLR